MKITFLGSGSAFVLAKENYQSNILVEGSDDKDKLLIDAGTTIAEALNAIGLDVKDINKIFITHNHADHTGGLEYIAFKRYFSTLPWGQDRPHLFAHHRTMRNLWEHNLKAGMSCIQDVSAQLDTYFKPHYLSGNGSFVSSYINCELIQTMHMLDNKRIADSHGLVLSHNDKVVFITGDSQLAPNQLLTHYNKADIIFQDCEVAKYPQSLHAQYHELRQLPEEIKAKMWLYHYSTTEKTDVVEDGFLGFVRRGQVFEI